MGLTGWVGVGLGGNCDCRCGILYALMLVEGGVVFTGLVSLTSSPYSCQDGRFRPKHVVFFPLLINTII